MRAPLTTVLGILTLVLGGAIAAELTAPGPAPAAALRRSGWLPALAAAPGGSGHVDHWAATILARPLFSPSRRPLAAAGGPDGLPRLAGVIVGPEGKTVIFAAVDGRAPTLAHEGGQVGPYRVQSIGVGEVTVRGPDGLRLLRPTFAASMPKAPPQRPLRLFTR